MLLEFIIALGLLILFHEAGHFLVGLLFKFKIQEFGIGYPPRMVKLFTKNGVDYTLNWIPFGGFTRFKGENDPQEQDGFHQQNKWKRLGVLLAGPAMNLLVGILLFTIVFANTGKAMTDQILVQSVEPNTPAAAAGLMAEDHIIKVNETLIDSPEILTSIIAQNQGKEVSIVVERNGTELTFQATPRKEYPDNQGPLGIVLTYHIEPIGLGESISSAFQMAKDQGEQLLKIPSQLIKGEVQPSEVRLVSPKGVYDIYSQVRTEEKASGESTKMGILNILWFFGVVSVSLGYGNLLPVPALDGGRVLFLLPELIFKKRLPEKFESAVNLIGFTILIVLMVYIFIHDFTNPIVLP
ncbi:MAG: site-2 protease family protein [Pelolinea sp.]|jgi:regulator of sigma E protease|nr:site-2 protease family protein [Pelolinea sp.]